MKRIFLVLALMVGLCSQAFAGSNVTHQRLTVAGSPVLNYLMATSATVTSDSIYQPGNFGPSALITNIDTGTVGKVTTTFQTSLDNILWYSPQVVIATNGTLTTASDLDSLQTANAWLIMPNTYGSYVRFKFIVSGDGQATIDSTYQWQYFS